MSEAVRPQNENRILAALPADDYQRLSPHLEPVELPHGQILCGAGGVLDYVYFPLNSMISLISQLSDGSSVEVGIAGYEGMAGVPVVLGVDRSFLAMMLGIRRAGVTEAALILQTEEFISYRRGHIKMLDRPGLEQFTCECYRIVKEEFDRVVG